MRIIDEALYDPTGPITPEVLHEAQEGDRVRVRYAASPERTINDTGAVRHLDPAAGKVTVDMDDGTTEHIGAGSVAWLGVQA